MQLKNTTKNRRNLGYMRLKAIKARNNGMSCKDIAMAFGVTTVSVSRWMSQYRAKGAAGLKPKKSSGRPYGIDCGLLFKKLKQTVNKPATKFGFNTPLWTTVKLKYVLNKELKFKISKTTIWRSLHEIGLSCQKPERRAFEANEEARKIWIKDFWPKLKQQASKERAVILFEDEASVSLIPNAGKTWGKIGITPIVKFTGKKGGVSIISAISTKGKLYFKIPRDTVDSAEFINFLKQILKEIPRKIIYMVVDGSTSHRSKKTKDFLLTQPRLRLVRLPSYSPDFNPDEYTWARLKSVELKGHMATSKSSLRAKALASMKSIQKKKGLVKSFIKRSKLT